MLLKWLSQLPAVMAMFAVAGAMPFHSVVDRLLIPASPAQLLCTGTATDVDVGIGAAAHELCLFHQDLPD